jgi:hypothetical protein
MNLKREQAIIAQILICQSRKQPGFDKREHAQHIRQRRIASMGATIFDTYEAGAHYLFAPLSPKTSCDRSRLEGLTLRDKETQSPGGARIGVNACALAAQALQYREQQRPPCPV